MHRPVDFLRQEIDQALAERAEMLDWIRRAQRIACGFQVTQSDWLQHGHLTPEDWLQDWSNQLDMEEVYPEDGYEVDELEEDPTCGYCGVRWCDGQCAAEDFRFNYWEEPDREFGGRLYPAEDVQAAIQDQFHFTE